MIFFMLAKEPARMASVGIAKDVGSTVFLSSL